MYNPPTFPYICAHVYMPLYICLYMDTYHHHHTPIPSPFTGSLISQSCTPCNASLPRKLPSWRDTYTCPHMAPHTCPHMHEGQSINWLRGLWWGSSKPCHLQHIQLLRLLASCRYVEWCSGVVGGGGWYWWVCSVIGGHCLLVFGPTNTPTKNTKTTPKQHPENNIPTKTTGVCME